MANRPDYRYRPIGSTRSLARVLNVDHGKLIEVANSSGAYWKLGKVEKKKNGEPRITNDALHPLKPIHFRIKERILAKVLYPPYILGGIASDEYTSRDYIENANIHADSKILISEDIENFFPSTTATMVKDIWCSLFHFPPDVSEVLTSLTVHKGSLPQGWITSNHLANLALWKHEAKFVTALEEAGFSYSRFVDDISVSSSGRRVEGEAKTKLVSDVIGFIKKCAFNPKRTKHEIATKCGLDPNKIGYGSSRGVKPMKMMGLNLVGKTASKPKDSRRITRSLVDHCVKYNPCARNSPIYIRMWDQASGQVGTLKRLHPEQAKAMRKLLSANRPERQPKKHSVKKKPYRKPLPPFSG